MGAYLSNPIRNKVNADDCNDIIAYGSCSMQGWRKDMEDSHFESLGFTEGRSDSLFGMFDGHGGSSVARYCQVNFQSILRSDPDFQAGRICEALRKTYLKLDQLLVSDPQAIPQLKQYLKESRGGSETPPSLRTPHRQHSHPAYNSGCTALVVYIDERTSKAYVANSGDSRAVLCRNGDAVELTTDHKVTLQSEADRIVAAGGVVLNGRVNGSLNLTRAIGDLAFKGDPSLSPENQMITANPDVCEIDINPDTDDFIVIACDGLWEVMKSQEVVDYILHSLQGIRGGSSPMGGEAPSAPSSPTSSSSIMPTSLSELIGNILDVACSDDVGKTEGVGGDNLSCILIDLRPGKPLVNLERVSRSGDPFLKKPSGYKAFDFKSASSSSSSDGFDDMEWECRIEKLE